MKVFLKELSSDIVNSASQAAEHYLNHKEDCTPGAKAKGLEHLAKPNTGKNTHVYKSQEFHVSAALGVSKLRRNVKVFL